MVTEREYETLADEVAEAKKLVQEQSQEMIEEEESTTPIEAKEEGEVENQEDDETPKEEASEDKPVEEELILGKFKTHEDVIKSYKELESKMGKDAEERKRLEAERADAIQKNLEWQEWSKSQESKANEIESEDDLDDPILKELNGVKKQLNSIASKEEADRKYNKAIQDMAAEYNRCLSDEENFPHFSELKSEMIALSKELEGKFPELSYNPNAIPTIYRMCEAKKYKGDYDNISTKVTDLESKNKELQSEINKLKKLSPEDEDAAFVEGGSISDGNSNDLDSLPLDEQVAALRAKLGVARK